MNHEKIRNKKSFLIPRVKNCQGTLNLHRSKYTDCIETSLFSVINGYMSITHVDTTNACLFLGHHILMNYLLISRWSQLNRYILQS